MGIQIVYITVDGICCRVKHPDLEFLSRAPFIRHNSATGRKAMFTKKIVPLPDKTGSAPGCLYCRLREREVRRDDVNASQQDLPLLVIINPFIFQVIFGDQVIKPFLLKP